MPGSVPERDPLDIRRVECLGKIVRCSNVDGERAIRRVRAVDCGNVHRGVTFRKDCAGGWRGGYSRSRRGERWWIIYWGGILAGTCNHHLIGRAHQDKW